MDSITLKGERNVWIDFTSKVKKNKKQVWDVLKPFIKEYIKNEH